MFIKQQDEVRNNTRLILVFEGIEEYFLFKKPLKELFKNKISILFTNGDRVRSKENEFNEYDFWKYETLAITDNDAAGIGIRNELIKRGIDAYTISDFFASDATHFEDLLVQEGLYPKWFRNFFSKKILDKYREDVIPRTKKELIDFVYKMEENMIQEESLLFLPLENIIREWYKWIRQRIIDDKSIPKKKNKSINSFFDVVYSIHQNSHFMLTKVKFEIPKLIDIRGTQMFEYLVEEIRKRI